MPDDVFEPQYSPEKKLMVSGLLIIAVSGGLLFAYSSFSLVERVCLLAGGVAAGVGAARTVIRPRKIIFGSAIVLKRPLLPDKRIEYTSVTEIGMSRLKAEKGSFSWHGMENGDELEAIVNRLVDDGPIPGRARHDESAARLFATIGALFAGTIGIQPILLLYWYGVIPLSWLPGMSMWVELGVFGAAIVAIVYGVLRYHVFQEPTSDRRTGAPAKRSGYDRSWKARHHFTPRLPILVWNELVGALIVSIPAPVVVAIKLYEPGEPAPVYLLLITLACAAAYIVVFAGRNLWRGMTRVEITRDAIRSSSWRGERTIRWKDVETCEYVGGGYWEKGVRMESDEGDQPLYVWFAGLSTEEIRTLDELIHQRLDEHGFDA